MQVSLIVAAVALAMILVELRSPARAWRPVAGWWMRAALLNVVQVLVILALGALWEPLIAHFQVIPGERLGTFWGSVVGYLVITFVYYWWHRARHEVDILWRWCHQVHHSPTRLEIITSFYKHPIEIAANGVLSSIILYSLLGLTPAQVAGTVLLSGLAELYYHWNVKTPWWTGFFMQRPEMHRIHHQTGRHRNNYADLPLWDILFGTFENPRADNCACGFKGNAELRLPAMLRGRVLEEV